MTTRALGCAALVVAAALALNGCASTPMAQKGRPSPAAPRNFVGDRRLPQPLVRVVLMPVWSGDAAPTEQASALDPVFATQLVRQKRFEVVTISREECRRRFGADALSSSGALPADFMEEIARDFAAQGVLFVDITAYHPIRPITLGIRAKLALTSSARLIWSFDDVYTAEDPSVLAGLKRFYAPTGGDRGEVPNNLPEAALLSPSRFGAYAADATFQTLPER